MSTTKLTRGQREAKKQIAELSAKSPDYARSIEALREFLFRTKPVEEQFYHCEFGQRQR